MKKRRALMMSLARRVMSEVEKKLKS